MRGRPIDASRVREVVEARGLDWLYFDETGSTNADALGHHAATARELVAFGEAQRSGRGRRGRDWLSPHACNIYCTVGLRRSIPAASQGLLSIVTGVALARSLRAGSGLEVNLKWPNDLLLHGRKLGGILIESRALADSEFFFAIGYGLNLFMSAAELDALDRPATSLGLHLGDELDRTALLIGSIEAVIDAVAGFELDNVDALVAEFAGLDAYHGRQVEVLTAGCASSGVNRGIDTRGQLRLQTERGLELHSAAEISLRAVDA